MHPSTRFRFGLITAVALVLTASALVLAARSDRYAPYWADAKTATTLENPLCTPVSAFAGMVKARLVNARTEEIRRASRYVGEVDGLFLYQTPHGNIWMPQENDLWSLAVVLAEQEQEVYGNAGGRGVRAGDVVIDGGAHVGLFTRTALAAGASKVITFEVTPNSNRALRKNLEKEIADGRVVVVEKGVWHEEGSLPLVDVAGCSVCNSVTHRLPATIDVPLTTIDLAVAELKLDRVDFIKLDIENAEGNALRGARQTIARYRPRLAVALENSRLRIAYGYEVVGIIRDALPSYNYACGSCTNPNKTDRVLPEILHFSPD